jgi:hypothetical protein
MFESQPSGLDAGLCQHATRGHIWRFSKDAGTLLKDTLPELPEVEDGVYHLPLSFA